MATGKLVNKIDHWGSFWPEDWSGNAPGGWYAEGTFSRTDFGTSNTKRGCQYAALLYNSGNGVMSKLKWSFATVAGHKYYYTLWIATDDVSRALIACYDNSTGNNEYAIYNDAPGSGQYISDIITIPNGNGSQLGFTTSPYDKAGSISITAVMLIDLTEAYGSGNEPSAVVMDAVVSQLGGFWTGEKAIPTNDVTRPGSVGSLNRTNVTDTTLQFSWANPNTAVAPVDGYHVYIQEGSSGWKAATLSTGGYQISGNVNTSCTITNLDTVNKSYQIKVVAFRNTVEGDFTPYNWTASGVSTDPKPPSVVTNFAAVSGKGDGTVTFTWSPPVYASNTAWDGFQIFCMSGAISNWTGYVYSGSGTLNGKKWIQINDKNARTYKWTGLTVGVTYQFIILAFNTQGGSTASDTVTVTAAALMPTYPLNFSVTRGAISTTAALSWAAPKTVGVPAYTSYQIWRQVKNPSGIVIEDYTTSPYASVTTTTFNDTGLSPKYTYSYKIAAANTYGPGAKTNAVSITIVGLPSAPRNVLVHLEDGTYPVITWSSPLDDGGEVQSKYTIYCDTTNGSVRRTIFDGTVQDAIQIDAKAGTHYYYKVAAINSAGEGASTSTEIVVPAEAKDTKLFAVGNVLTNGNFDLDNGTTNWTINPVSAATCIDSPTGFWVGKVLRMTGGDAYTDVNIPAGHTLLLTCKMARVAGTTGNYGSLSLCPKDTYNITADSSALNATSNTPTRKWTASNVLSSYNGVRVLVRAPTTGAVTMDIDGIMLIDLSNVYGHACVFTTESTKFTDFIGLVDGFLGGYWEGCFTLTKIIG